MSDTTTERSPAIRHPQSVLDDAVALVDKIEIPENLQDIVEFVARTVLPPPNVWALLRAADVVRTHVRDRRAEAEGLISFLKTVDTKRIKYSGEEYPAFYATQKIGRIESPGAILTILMNLFFGRWSTSSMFRVRTYYKDILAIRDALRLAERRRGDRSGECN